VEDRRVAQQLVVCHALGSRRAGQAAVVVHASSSVALANARRLAMGKNDRRPQ